MNKPNVILIHCDNHGFGEYYGIPYSNDMGRLANTGNSSYPPLPLMIDIEVTHTKKLLKPHEPITDKMYDYRIKNRRKVR